MTKSDYYEKVTIQISGHIPGVLNPIPTITEMLNYLEELTDSPITKVCRTCKCKTCKEKKQKSLKKLLNDQKPTKQNLINKIMEVEGNL